MRLKKEPMTLKGDPMTYVIGWVMVIFLLFGMSRVVKTGKTMQDNFGKFCRDNRSLSNAVERYNKEYKVPTETEGFREMHLTFEGYPTPFLDQMIKNYVSNVGGVFKDESRFVKTEGRIFKVEVDYTTYTILVPSSAKPQNEEELRDFLDEFHDYLLGIKS